MSVGCTVKLKRKADVWVLKNDRMPFKDFNHYFHVLSYEVFHINIVGKPDFQLQQKTQIPCKSREILCASL